MQNKQMKQMMGGAAVLTVAAFFSKLLSALYKVPFQNLTGNEGFYVYQQVYPLYGLALALSLSGLPVFLSKVTAEVEEVVPEGRRLIQAAILKRIFGLLAGFSLGLFLLVHFGAGVLAGWMGDKGLTPMIRSVSWMYLFLPVLAVLRGFFQGNLNMIPTAVSQVSEQLVRVGVILTAAFLYHRNGGSIYAMGTFAFRSAWLSAIVASVVLVYFYWKSRPDGSFGVSITGEFPPSYKQLGRRLLTEGATISLIGSLLILLQLVDSFTIYKGLVKSGIGKPAAMALKGIYDRGQPLVQLGMVAAVGLASGLLPLLRMQRIRGEMYAFTRTSRSVLRITAVFAGASAVGLIAVMPDLNRALFNDQAGTDVLRLFVVSVLLISLISAYNSVLQSLDHHRLIFAGVLGAVVVKTIGNILLVPLFGTAGASISTVLGLWGMYRGMRIFSPIALNQVRLDILFCAKLAGALAGMALVVWLIRLSAFQLFPEMGRTGALISTLFEAGAGSLVFLFLAIRLRVLTIREWLSIPLGKQLLRGRKK